MEQSVLKSASSDLELRNSECDLCRFSATCKTVCVIGEGNIQADLMIIGDMPSDYDDERNTVMRSHKDKLLRYIIKEAMGVDPESVYITYLTKCKPMTGVKPDEKEAKICYDAYLLKEINTVRPKAILTLGDIVSTVVAGVKGITKNRGNIVLQDFGYGDIPVIPTYAPAYAASTQNMIEIFAKDIDKSYLIATGASFDGKKVPYKWVTTEEQMHELCDYIIEVGKVYFDFETDGLDPYKGTKPTLLTVSFQIGFGYAIPMLHFQSPLTEEEVRALMVIFNERVLQNPDVDKGNHNLKFDLHMMHFFGIEDVRGRINDTMLMAHLLNEDRKVGLKEIVGEVFPEYKGYEDEVKKYKWAEVPMDLLVQYGVTDTDRSLALSIQFEAELLKDPQLYNIYRNLSMPAMRSLFYAEKEGFPVDIHFLEQSIKDTQVYIDSMDIKLRSYKQVKRWEEFRNTELLNAAIYEQEQKIIKATEENKPRVVANANKKLSDLRTGVLSIGEPVNFASAPQMGQLLYTPQGFGFKMPYSKKHKKEHPVTDRPALLSLKDKTGFIHDLMIMRSMEKMQSTYMQGILDLLDAQHKVHTSFLIHGTETGRLSSRSPNMQNIPRNSKIDNEGTKDIVSRIKKFFVAEEGHYLVQVDYSQAELRIAADFANETTMLTAYQNDEDLHILTARQVNNYSVEDWNALDKSVAKELRSNAKAGNFGLIYGMSADGLVDYARNNYGVEFTLQEAEAFRNRYFKSYGKLLAWHAGAIAQGQKQGFVRTLFGRKRHLPDIFSDNNMLKSEDERIAINSPVQGSAGEFTVMALVLLTNRLPISVKLINTVHDSIIYMVPKDIIQPVCKLIKNTCENLPTLKYFGAELDSVKMKVDLEYSDTNWSELKPIDFEI